MAFEFYVFWNNEVLANIDAVLEQIYQALNNPHPSLSRKRARVKEEDDAERKGS